MNSEKRTPQKGEKLRRRWRGFWQTVQKRRWLLPALCYALALAGTLCADTVRLAVDAMDRANGTLTARELSLADFTLVNAHAEGEGVLVSENEDPQMRYALPEGGRLDSLTVAISYDRYPYERCLYYTTRPGEEFGQNKRVWATENADGSLTFQLPRGVRAIRLDPGSASGLHMTFSRLTLNAPRTAADYFLPSGGGWFALLVLPAFAAAVLQWLAELCAACARARRARADRLPPDAQTAG